MQLFLGMLWIILLASFMDCIPVDKVQKKIKNEKASFGLGDASQLSRVLRSRLDVLKYQLNHAYLALRREKYERPENVKITIKPDLATILKINDSADADIDFVLKEIRKRLDAIDDEELDIFNGIEISKVLDKWEDHVNDTTVELERARRDLETNKAVHKKRRRFRKPGSRAQEIEQWQKEDEMPARDYSPQKFFLLHDLKNDGVWDSEELDALLSFELHRIDKEQPERIPKHRIEMRRELLKSADKNGDGLIDVKEHVNYVNSVGAKNEDRQPDNDEDEDLDNFGPVPRAEELSEIAAGIRRLESVDKSSEFAKQLKNRFVRFVTPVS